MKEYLKIVVAGDVDSGKSTLIGRFLFDFKAVAQGVIEEVERTCNRLGSGMEFAYLLDSLEEERVGQLTIDTTQVFCKNKKSEGFIFIDVPGHQELIKNMLSGSSYADMSVLVVDAEKSVEEQTRRHAFILKFLGIDRVVVVINKMDKIRFNESVFKKAEKNIADVFKKIGLDFAECIPVSAKEGDNLCRSSRQISWYKGSVLRDALKRTVGKSRSVDFRFLVQDIYPLGAVAIAAGQVISGSIAKGAKVTVLPSGVHSSVKKIRSFEKWVSSAVSPDSPGLVLDDMRGVKRGQIICKPCLPFVTREIHAKIFCVQSMDIKEGFILCCAIQEGKAIFKRIIGVWDSVNLEPKQINGFFSASDIVEAVISVSVPFVVEKMSIHSPLGRFVLKNGGISAIGYTLDAHRS